jgi:hypothetical protein
MAVNQVGEEEGPREKETMCNQRAIKPAGDHLNQAPFACSAAQRTHNGLTNRHVLISGDDSSVRGRWSHTHVP